MIDELETLLAESIMKQDYNMMNMEDWPSLFSYYVQDGGRIPGEALWDDEKDPAWSPVPPDQEGMYWIFDIHTRTVLVMSLYRLDDETVEEPLTINVYSIPGLNPDCDSMTGKVLYGPQAGYDTLE